MVMEPLNAQTWGVEGKPMFEGDCRYSKGVSLAEYISGDALRFVQGDIIPKWSPTHRIPQCLEQY